MKVLIIGGTGLISTATTRLLLERGDDVTHYNRGRSAVRLPAGLPAPKVITGDRTDAAAFERQVTSAGKFDVVIDMVCYQPAEAASDVRAFRGRVGQLVFCSTVDAYVKPYARFPITEDAPIGGLTEYGKAKARCERLLLDAHDANLPVTILRPAHTYGEGGHLIDVFGWNSHFIDRLRQGMPIVSHGDGQSLWGACYIDDVARAFVASLGNAKALGRAYHTAADEVLPWDAYYAAIGAAVGNPRPELVHIPTTLLARALPARARECLENFQFDNLFDNAAARRDLGFHQTVSFAEGAKRTCGWLLANGKLHKAADAPVYDRIIAAWRSVERDFVGALAGADA